MKNERFVTLCSKYNNSTNVLFAMTKDDVEFRNGPCSKPGAEPNYTIIEKILISKGAATRGDGHLCPYKAAIGESGQVYKLFADYSLEKVEE